MSDRSLDLLVLGATGFTGQRVAEYLARVAQQQRVQWAIAGRSQDRLNQLANKIEADGLRGPDDILICNIDDEASLVAAFRQAKVVLNCTGPYRFLGEACVRAALAAGANIMDISGEPQYMESMFLKYHQEAQSKGILVLNACAFDSVPADLGYLFTMRQFKTESHCNAVESFLQLHSGEDGIRGHYTTYECAVHGFGDADSLRDVRQQVKEQLNPPSVKPVGPRLRVQRGAFKDARMAGYSYPFMGSDASVVKSSQRTLAMRTGETRFPVYAAYVNIGSTWNMMLMATFGGIFSLLAQSEAGRNLLLRYPEFFTMGKFTHDGPTEHQMQATSFATTFFARGYSDDHTLDSRTPGEDNERTSLADDSNAATCDKFVVTRVAGPEPGYVATPMIFVTLALALLKERDSIPAGGVLTPSSAFYDVLNIFDLLSDAGVKFSVLEA